MSRLRDTGPGLGAAEHLSDGSGVSRTKLRAVGTSQIIAELGHGGMANVYLAVAQGQAGVQKLVVLKALRPELEAEPEAVQMFFEEARIAAQLNHPNVVQTYEIGVHDGRSVLVMEYLEGQSLARLLRECTTRRRPLPLAIALRIVITALEGLHYAHEVKGYDGRALNLVHRDISPQNILVTYDGQVKILDFGIAKVSASSTHTAIGVVKGKFAYMSPEQMRSYRIDRRADVFSMGCVLWALATGERLWRDVPDAQIIVNVMAGDIPSVLTKNPDCDPELAQIIARALACDPEHRHATALELQADLERYCEKLGPPVTAKAVGKLLVEIFAESRARIRGLIQAQLSQLAAGAEQLSSVRILDETSTSKSLPRSATFAPPSTFSEEPPPRRGRWLPAAAIVTLLASVAFTAWQASDAWRRRSAPPPVLTAARDFSPVTRVAPVPSVESARPATPSKTFLVRFDVKPRDARILLDGRELPAKTLAREFAADGSTHRLRVEAWGYQPGELEFTVTQETTIELSLAKAQRSRSRSGAATSRAAATSTAAASIAASSATTPARPAADACADPFFIGADGIKQVRPECR